MYCAYLGEGWRAKTTCRKTLWAPSAMTWPLVRRSCGAPPCGVARPKGHFCRGGPAVPRAVACGAQQPCHPERGTEHRHARSVTDTPLSALISSETAAGSGNCWRFPESEVIRRPPTTRQATYPICPLHDLAIRTQTPGAGRASHGEELNVARASAYSPPDAPTFAHQIDEILSIFRSLGWVRHGGATRISRSR